MLYAYLRHFGGICATMPAPRGWAPTGATTIPSWSPLWRSTKATATTTNAREHRGFLPGELASAKTGGEAPHPKGFIWKALAKGYRLGFESSSDHVSTHSSYAILLVEQSGRQALIDAFRARRCYAATDNILLVVKCGGHLMGEEFALAGWPTLEIQARGTAPIAKLEIIRNNRYVYSGSPNAAAVDLRWTDTDPPAGGVNYYYVRLQQADTNLAWSSPLWIHAQRN